MRDLPRWYAGKVLPADLQAILGKLADLFGERLRVTAINAEGFACQVWGLTDECLIRRMEMEQARIFGPDLGKFQVLCRLDRYGERVVHVRHLRDAKMREEYLAGFWYV